jgi:hypothetical protein
MDALRRIPTGFHPSAQGCRVGEATLGQGPSSSSTLKGLHPAALDLITPRHLHFHGKGGKLRA